MIRLSLLLLFLASGAAAQPKLAFESERYDFGTFDEGETVTHVFRFTNTGDQPLEVREVVASCGCTTPNWTNEPVAPGASGEITVLFNSTARPGPFEKTIRVIAPEAEDGRVTLRIVGEVTSQFAVRGIAQGALTFETDHFAMGTLASGEALQKAFRFQNTGDRPVKILEIRSFQDGVAMVFPQRPVFPGDVAAVMVTVEDPSALARAGRVDVALAVVTDDADMPTKSLRLSGKVGG